MLIFLFIAIPAQADISGDWTTSQGHSFTVSETGVISGLKLEIDTTVDWGWGGGPEAPCGVSSFLASFDDIQTNENGAFPSQSLFVSLTSPNIVGTVWLNAGQFDSTGKFVGFSYSSNVSISTPWCNYSGTSGGSASATKQPKATDTFVLTINKSGNGDGTVSGDGTYFYNTIVTPAATPSLGSKFTGWQPESCANPFPLIADTVCTANFALNTYNISIQSVPSSGGSITCNPNPANHNGFSTCIATPNVGYQFENWGGDCTGQPESTCTLTNVIMEKSVVGNFKLKNYVLSITKTGLGSGSVKSNPTGLDCGNACSASYAHGEVVMLSATSAKGSSFSGWSGSSCAGNGTCQITMNEPKTANAEFSLLPPFGDVDPNGWAAGYIYALRNEGITGGCGNGNYCPKDYVTREQMAAFLIRTLEDDPDQNYCGGVSPFIDVDALAWSCPHIKRLNELEITGGCGNGNYCPKAFVTREQMAAFIIRALEGDPPNGYCQGLPPFNDVPANSWACGHIKRLIEEGITQGCGNGNYCPAKIVTREEMAAFLARAFLDMD